MFTLLLFSEANLSHLPPNGITYSMEVSKL